MTRTLTLGDARVPSANRMYRSRGGPLHLARRYREWLDAEAWTLRAQWSGPPWTGPVAVSIQVPADRRRDLDNHAKPLLDLLEVARVIADDRQVARLSLEWGPPGSPPEVRLSRVADAADSGVGRSAKPDRNRRARPRP